MNCFMFTTTLTPLWCGFKYKLEITDLRAFLEAVKSGKFTRDGDGYCYLSHRRVSPATELPEDALSLLWLMPYTKNDTLRYRLNPAGEAKLNSKQEETYGTEIQAILRPEISTCEADGVDRANRRTAMREGMGERMQGGSEVVTSSQEIGA